MAFPIDIHGHVSEVSEPNGNRPDYCLYLLVLPCYSTSGLLRYKKHSTEFCTAISHTTPKWGVFQLVPRLIPKTIHMPASGPVLWSLTYTNNLSFNGFDWFPLHWKSLIAYNLTLISVHCTTKVSISNCSQDLNVGVRGCQCCFSH